MKSRELFSHEFMRGTIAGHHKKERNLYQQSDRKWICLTHFDYIMWIINVGFKCNYEWKNSSLYALCLEDSDHCRKKLHYSYPMVQYSYMKSFKPSPNHLLVVNQIQIINIFEMNIDSEQCDWSNFRLVSRYQ